MRFSEQWLREWVNPDLSATQIAERLTMAGLEVDSVTPAAPEFSKVIVGLVEQCDQHPDADRLKVCQVNVGESKPIQIVCGGVNVRQGLKVPVSVVGAVLPGDFKIKKSKLRGVESQGMICSSTELGIADGNEVSHGIMELPEDAPIGQDVREYLLLDDQVIDIELTPNRGDCLGIKGIARELNVLCELDAAATEVKQIPAAVDDTFPIELLDSSACPRYVGRVIRNIKPHSKTPVWMQERLRRSGVRCIHPIVDICNYVMFELGQPMHAFDLQTLSNKIVIRKANTGEKLKLLDGNEIELHADALVIADEQQPQALAGIMGGLGSAVNDVTVDIFLESAFFSAVDIRLAARRFGLQTDSSYRFERGVDYQLQRDAIERATALIIDIVGGEPGPVTEVVDDKQLPQLSTVQLRKNQIQRMLGIQIEDVTAEQILQRLGMTVKSSKDDWQVSTPSFRFDIEQEIDLIEELARIYGYNNIPSQPLETTLQMPEVSEYRVQPARINQLLVDLGYNEVVTYSFVDKELQDKLTVTSEDIELTNPIASNMSVMRRSIWPGLIATAQYNLNRQASRIRLFETGLCFTVADGEWQQTPRLAMLLCGDVVEQQWAEPARKVDFYDMKGDIEQLLNLTNQISRFEWQVTEHPILHPGQSALLKYDGREVGVLGTIHPTLAAQLDLPNYLILFEIDLDVIQHAELAQAQPISKFPAIRRDLALVVDKSLEVQQIVDRISQQSGQILRKVQIFDIYVGEGIEKDKKSVALGLTFQHPSRTLIDSEINEVIQQVVEILESDFKAQLRA